MALLYIKHIIDENCIDTYLSVHWIMKLGHVSMPNQEQPSGLVKVPLIATFF